MKAVDRHGLCRHRDARSKCCFLFKPKHMLLICEAHDIDARCQSWTEREVRFLIRMKNIAVSVHGQNRCPWTVFFFDKNGPKGCATRLPHFIVIEFDKPPLESELPGLGRLLVQNQ
jgi:hypothetical protein